MSTITEPSKKPSPIDAPTHEPRSVTLPDGRPDVSLLEDQLPDWLKASKGVAILTGVLGLIFFCLSRLAIFTSDVWGHLAYGRWMIEHGRIPTTEPLLALAQGVPWVDTAWLSKLTGFWVFQQFGVAGLQFIHALTLTAAFTAIAVALYRRSRSVGWTVLGLLAFGIVDYQQLLIQRPQDIGLACFAITLVCGLSLRSHRSLWIALPLMFAVWANFHGSFMVGLLTLCTIAVGRGIDLWQRTGRFRMALSSRLVWGPFVLMELCAAAVLLNPEGIRIYADVFTISGNANLPSLLDWSPLTLRMPQGMAFAAVVVLLGIVYRFSPRRVRASEFLLLVGFGVAALWSLRMIVWWGPVAGYLFGLHGAAAWRRVRHLAVLPTPPERRGLWSVATVGLAWIFFAYTPFGLQRLHGMPQGEEAAREFRHSVVERTPLDAVDYLTKHADDLPGGLMYNSQEWGDYLLWAAPKKFQVFVNSHVHLIPSEVWTDFLIAHDGGDNATSKLDRYGVNTVLVDATNYMGLIRTLRDDSKWKEVFTDPAGRAVLFVRRVPVK